MSSSGSEAEVTSSGLILVEWRGDCFRKSGVVVRRDVVPGLSLVSVATRVPDVRRGHSRCQ